MIYKNKKIKKIKKRIRKILDGEDVLDRYSSSLSLGGSAERSHKDLVGKRVRRKFDKIDVGQKVLNRIEGKIR